MKKYDSKKLKVPDVFFEGMYEIAGTVETYLDELT